MRAALRRATSAQIAQAEAESLTARMTPPLETPQSVEITAPVAKTLPQELIDQIINRTAESNISSYEAATTIPVSYNYGFSHRMRTVWRYSQLEVRVYADYFLLWLDTMPADLVRVAAKIIVISPLKTDTLARMMSKVSSVKYNIGLQHCLAKRNAEDEKRV